MNAFIVAIMFIIVAIFIILLLTEMIRFFRLPQYDSDFMSEVTRQSAIMSKETGLHVNAVRVNKVSFLLEALEPRVPGEAPWED
jgi:hypothetical protein